MAWDGRGEYVGSGQVTHFRSLKALLAFMGRVLTDVQDQAAAP